MTAKWATQAKPDLAMLMLLAVIGIGGLIVARRYGVVNRLRTGGSSAARSIRKRRARRVRPKVLRFSRPG